MPPHKPAAAQPKMAATAHVMRRPVPAAAYLPQSASKTSQGKSLNAGQNQSLAAIASRPQSRAMQPKTAGGSQLMKPHVAAPANRPQSMTKILPTGQDKAVAQQTTSGRAQVARPVSRPNHSPQNGAIQPMFGWETLTNPWVLGTGLAIGVLAVGKRLWTLRKYMTMQNLAAFRTQTKQSSQGTTAFISAWGQSYYMIEQETCTEAARLAEADGVNYIRQSRESFYHAEMRFLEHFMRNNWTLKGTMIWVSKPICAKCALKLKQKGVLMMTTADMADWREDWVDPDARMGRNAPALVPTGTVNRQHGWGGLLAKEEKQKLDSEGITNIPHHRTRTGKAF